MQIPRYGKRFKSFKGVIPSLELDVSVLCENFGKIVFISKIPISFFYSQLTHVLYVPNQEKQCVVNVINMSSIKSGTSVKDVLIYGTSFQRDSYTN